MDGEERMEVTKSNGFEGDFVKKQKPYLCLHLDMAFRIGSSFLRIVTKPNNLLIALEPFRRLLCYGF
ncbi:hypothetical protein [Flagellimonas sp. GZD32]|uniref:hypothetical protein n=1 Tax=Flagellimonas cixiensis TaxID=3228750 RepID=UPI0035C8F478